MTNSEDDDADVGKLSQRSQRRKKDLKKRGTEDNGTKQLKSLIKHLITFSFR